MQMTELYGTSSSLDKLTCELELLSSRYRNFLEQESLMGDIQCLHNWISSYKNGRLDAAEYIHEYGYDLLANVKQKLKATEGYIEHMDTETLNAENFDSFKAHKISGAVALTSEMQDLVKEITHDEVNA